MIISVTERGTFKRCRRRWDYSSFNRQGLESIINRPALALGSLIHKVLEEWTFNPEFGDPNERYLLHAALMTENVKMRYHDHVGAKISEYELGPVVEAMMVGQTMIKNYVEYWKTPLPPEYHIVQTEQTVIVAIPGHDDAWLEGTLDGLVGDYHGGLYVLENKTYGQRPNFEVLDTNDQFLAYYWILKQLIATGMLEGYDHVGGILYNGLWKHDVTPPKKDGTARKKTYDLKDLFLRHLFQRDPAEVEEFEQHLQYEYADMLACMTGEQAIYPNRRWEGCRDCSFDRLCTAQSKGEDWEYVRGAYYQHREETGRLSREEGDGEPGNE